MICDYGCGREAGYQFKNGKWCCEKNRESCSKVKENIKHKFIEKYGVDNPSRNKKIQEKRKKTCMKKYGVEYFLKNKEVQEKRKKVCIEKYGVEYPFKSKELQRKIKQTFIEKYGVDNPNKNKNIQEKRKKTCMKKYGVDNPRKSLENKKDFLKKHKFFSQVEEIKIEDNEFKVRCKNHNCLNSKEKGGWFVPTLIQIRNRIAVLENDMGNYTENYFYCCQECKDQCPLFNLRSDPNKDTQLPHTQEQYQTFRLHVLIRDNYICQFCGAPATDVHHEIAVKLQPFHALDPEYAWSCCEKCHYAKGHPKGTDCSTGNLAAKVCEPIIKKKENFI